MPQPQGTIAVTPRSLSRAPHPALEALAAAGYEVVFPSPGRQPTEQQLLAALPACVGMIAGVEPITARVLDAAERLKVISRNGTGVENIDLAAAERRGIVVCRAEGANARGVAELTIGLMLALVRSVPFHDAALKARNWQRRRGIELAGRTLGLIGCGRIGKAVATLALAFDMNVLAFDPMPDTSFRPSERFAYAAFEQVLAAADVLSLHCPARPDRRPVIDAEALAAVRAGAYLVNTARGSLLDEAAVLAALDADRLAGLAIDAYDSEPPEDWRLARHPRVIATPHVGGFTEQSVHRAATAAVENLLTALEQFDAAPSETSRGGARN